MKVLILACLLALAFAKEGVESSRSSEELITPIEDNLETSKYEQEQQREDVHKKIHPIQPQPLLYPYLQSTPSSAFPQSILPLSPVAVPSFSLPKMMEAPKLKVLHKDRPMPFLKPLRVPLLDPHVLNLVQLKNQLPHFQPPMYQVPQPFSQFPILPPLSSLHHPQPNVVFFPWEAVSYPVASPQRAMSVPALPQYQELLFNPIHQFPLTQGFPPVYNAVVVSPNLFTLVF
ncbi:beta-casein [Tupaia chinensis]|uniref:beta-casein n=1 Tax=Tupaia chinensis TaxID=246437 RepID=UPI0003C8D859|nr:beta-casein [Tupaia chinensis]